MKENIQWQDLRIIIPYVIGQMSEKKILAILAGLKENQFKNAKVVRAEINAAVISLAEGEKNLLIEPQKITFASHLEGIFDIEAIQVQFSSILNALLIDDENQYLINIEGTSETEDSHTESKQFFEEKYATLDDEIYGVGYRFLIKNEELFGEFRMEPFVTDKTKYYYQWGLNKVKGGTIEDMLHDVQDIIRKERSGCYSVIKR